MMTPRDLVSLLAIKSPLVAGGAPTVEDMGRFLWMLSPDSKPGEAGFLAFTHSTPALDVAAMAREIGDYIEFVFLDRLSGGKANGNPSCSFVAFLVDFFKAEYGWEDEVTMGKPLPRLFQYQRAALMRKGQKLHVNRLEDRAKLAYILARNAVPVEHQDRWHNDQWEEMNRG